MTQSKKVRTHIPAEIETKVKVEAGFKCSMPRCGVTSGLEIHHIDGNPSNHDSANLLLLCAVCHARVTEKEINRKACEMIKETVQMQSLTASDLERMESRIVSRIESLVGNQKVARPLVREDKGVCEPDPRIDAAASQALTFQKARLPLPTGILRALAKSLYDSCEFDGALAIVQLVLRTPDATGADYSNLGVFLEETGRKEEAEEAYRKAISADPNCAMAWFNLGILRMETGRKEEAEEAYRKAITADPKATPAWSNLGVLLNETGRKGEAEEAYHKAITADPKATPAWSNLGVLLNETGRKEEAEEAYRKAITADPKYGKAWSNLGVLLNETGRKEEAEEAYRKAISADPQNAEAWSNLGVLLNETGRKEEAEEAYRKAVAAGPADAEWRNAFAYFLWQNLRFDESESELREALRIDPSHCYANATFGLLQFEKDDLESGRKGYERAIELAPDDKPLLQKYHFEYGRALARNDKTDEARQEFQAALNVDSEYIPKAQIETELAKLG